MRNCCAVPTCYFPSTVVFIDDSREFLMNFTLQLDDNLAYKIFDSPYDALEAIYSSQKELDNLNQRCMTEYLDNNEWPMTNQTVNLDLAAIHWEVYNPNRFSEVSVVIVDYAMPGMNGLEFCKRMEHSPIKKILLTGEADEKVAVEAFNDGIIDRFVQKSDPNVTKLITDSIHKLQREYFQNMSDMIIKMLSVNSLNCLEDARFAVFFKEICERNNIIEFYLMENTGSYLLLDERGKVYCLVMKNEQDLKLHYDMALDNNAPDTILDQLESGEKIPYFWQNTDINSGWNDWSSCLFPANKIECNDTYHYALIEDPRVFDIHHERILSYHQYLERMDINAFAEATA